MSARRPHTSQRPSAAPATGAEASRCVSSSPIFSAMASSAPRRSALDWGLLVAFVKAGVNYQIAAAIELHARHVARLCRQRAARSSAAAANAARRGGFGLFRHRLSRPRLESGAAVRLRAFRWAWRRPRQSADRGLRLHASISSPGARCCSCRRRPPRNEGARGLFRSCRDIGDARERLHVEERAPSIGVLPPRCMTAAFVLCLIAIALWTLTHRYQGHTRRLRTSTSAARSPISIPTGIGRDMMFVDDGQSRFSLFPLLLERLVVDARHAGNGAAARAPRDGGVDVGAGFLRPPICRLAVRARRLDLRRGAADLLRRDFAFRLFGNSERAASLRGGARPRRAGGARRAAHFCRRRLAVCSQRCCIR